MSRGSCKSRDAIITGRRQNQVTILQGTVFTLKTSPEVSKSRVFRLSTETLNECRAWFQAFENVDGVVMQVNCDICRGRTRGRGREGSRETEERQDKTHFRRQL